MVEEYLKTWKSIFKITQPLTRKDFWIFLVFNYIVSIIISCISNFSGAYIHFNPLNLLDVVFVLATILAIIKLSNNKKMLADDNNLENLQPLVNIKSVVKLLLISIAIGLINFLVVIMADSNNSSINLAYVLLIYCACLVPLSFIILLITVAFRKKRITNESIINYFIIALILSLIIQFALMCLD